jgi:hypothetical protein
MKGKQVGILVATIAVTLGVTAGVANSAPSPKTRITTVKVAASSANDTTVVKVQSADCPTGTLATGGGYDFLGSNDVAAGVLISSSLPTGSNNSEGWTIAAVNRSGITDADWGIEVWAVCAS